MPRVGNPFASEYGLTRHTAKALKARALTDPEAEVMSAGRKPVSSISKAQVRRSSSWDLVSRDGIQGMGDSTIYCQAENAEVNTHGSRSRHRRKLVHARAML